MASRVTKPGNTKEFAQATQPWHIADLDSDLDNLFNAGIDTTNIAVNAGFVGTQLASGTITATRIVTEDAGASSAHLLIPWAAAPVALEAPTTGTYTYTLTAQVTTGTEFGLNQVSTASLVALEFA